MAVSKASDRKAMSEVLAAYSLMSVADVAHCLGCSDRHVRTLVRRGVLPGIRVGELTKIDPIDVAVYMLAGRAGMTSAEYWQAHGEATPERARDLVATIRKATAA